MSKRWWSAYFGGGRPEKRARADSSDGDSEQRIQPSEMETVAPTTPLARTVDTTQSRTAEATFVYDPFALNRLLQNARDTGDMQGFQALLDDPRRSAHALENIKQEALWLDSGTTTGCPQIVRFVLATGVDVDSTSRFGMTRLHKAVAFGQIEVLELLISSNADVNKADTTGDTPLLSAVRNRHTAIVKLLVEARADVNKLGKDGESALHAASCDQCDVELVKFLLASHARVDVVDEGGKTLLHSASWDSRTEVLVLLLAAHTDVNAKDTNGRTPLYIASSTSQTEAVVLLLAARADVNAKDTNCKTPLHAVSNAAVARYLVHAGACLSAVDDTISTPLHCACANESSDVVKVLLDAGSKVDVADNEGSHPIHVGLRRAWSQGCCVETMRILQLLVASGSKWDTTCTAMTPPIKTWPSSRLIQPFEADDQRWEIEGPAVRACVLRWIDELQDGLSLMEIPIEEVKKGLVATETYINEIAASNDVVIRHKICVVGPSYWGKTSLIKSLTTNKPSLVHPDDRTIGINHFTMEFEEGVPGLRFKKHEVTFWDFAGQDAYQVAHSLFFSARTLYVVCIDLQSYVTALMQADLMTDYQSQADRWMNEFIDTRVLRWIRLVFARQPDAEFVFLATKKDKILKRELMSEHCALADLTARLKNVLVIVQELKALATPQRAPPSVGDVDSYTPITTLSDPRLTKLRGKPSATLIVSSCTTVEAVQTVKEALRGVITKSDRGFPMPDKYFLVLEAVLRIRFNAARMSTDLRLAATFVDIKFLMRQLQAEVLAIKGEVQSPVSLHLGRLRRTIRHYEAAAVDEPGLDDLTCVTILQTLRDLGDVLWYGSIDDEAMRNTVILDPLLMIDFVRQVINHKHTSETMPHAKLKGLPFWVSLDEVGMLYMKRVLQHFSLVHPTYGKMKAASDLIVPGYWKTNTCAFWKFGGDILRLGRRTKESDLALRVHWEFHFVNEFPDSLFDNLVVASYAATYTRDVGPDWILYERENVYACRVVLGRDNATHQRSLHLEALLSHGGVGHANALWTTFQHIAGKLERVLHGFPGLCVTSFAWNRADTQHDLESVFASPVSPDCETWMPPAAMWQEFSSLAM